MQNDIDTEAGWIAEQAAYRAQIRDCAATEELRGARVRLFCRWALDKVEQTPMADDGSKYGLAEYFVDMYRGPDAAMPLNDYIRSIMTMIRSHGVAGHAAASFVAMEMFSANFLSPEARRQAPRDLSKYSGSREELVVIAEHERFGQVMHSAIISQDPRLVGPWVRRDGQIKSPFVSIVAGRPPVSPEISRRFRKMVLEMEANK